MHLRNRVAAGAVAILLAAAVGGVVAAALRAGAEQPGAASSPDEDLAVVLAPGSSRTKLVVVDLDRRAVVRRIALRSLATDIDIDERTGLIVAAQTGGIGDEADDAVSIVDPRTGRVRYVTLPVRDPASVVCLDGRAYVLHSVLTTGGLVASVVDVASARVAGSGRVPDGPGLWARAAGALWAARVRGEQGWDVVRVDTGTLSAAAFEPDAPLVSGLGEARGRLVLLGGGSGAGPGGPASVRLVDPASGVVIASCTATALPYPARSAAQAADTLVVGDWGGQEPETRRLAVLDAETLAPRGVVDVPGVPCALAAWGSRIVVVERTRGTLLVIDPISRAVAASIDLGTGELPLADVVVADRARR